ncbi:hypothetical protein [Calothrix sp. 336/3]|uniref:hypothetical protein n=1 Tax=Calothrix sp. 336/3 TaxID=1337936 RepID=UPI0004E295A0|nr:hypothetical protein [Calothrix sp. 336/3]AKG19978.1 hypothetical protein IJ00_00410 [Calothrix sp. 336/3]
MRKTLIFTLVFTSLITLPAVAQLGKIWTDFQSYSVDLQNYYRNNVYTKFRPLEIQTQSAITNANGALNLPNPIGLEQQVTNDIILNSFGDEFENNPAVNAVGVSNNINRLLTEGAVLGILGSAGQTRLKGKLIETDNIIKEIAAETSSLDKIQNGLENTIKADPKSPETAAISALANFIINQITVQLKAVRIQERQTKLNAESLGQTIQLNQSLQYSNLNLAAISQQLEVTNRSRRVDEAAEAARLLRVTSQVDLFGREEKK